MKTTVTAIVGLTAIVLMGCRPASTTNNFVQEDIKYAVTQHTLQTDIIEKSGRFFNPRTIVNGKIQYVPIDDWTSGFFPGSLWYDYALTNDTKWSSLAKKYTEELDSVKY